MMKMLVIMLGLYVVYGLIMIALHPRFIYPFVQAPFQGGGWTRPKIPDADISVVWGDGVDETAILFFMGNAGALAYFGPTLNAHVAAGRPVAALEYRGGGGVAGTPSEAQLKADALVAFDWLRSTHTGPIAVHGYSMGTGLLACCPACKNGIQRGSRRMWTRRFWCSTAVTIRSSQ